VKQTSPTPASYLVRIPARAYTLCRSLQRPGESLGAVVDKALVTLARSRNRRKARKGKVQSETS
jgi:hypothetical protein